MSNLSDLIEEMNSAYDELLEVKREPIPEMKKNFPEFVEAYKGLVTGQSTEVIQGYIQEHIGDYVKGQLEVLNGNITSLGMVMYKGTTVAKKADKDITSLHNSVSLIQSELEQFKEVFISSKGPKISFSAKYNQILPVAKNLADCDIGTGTIVSIFDADNEGNTLDCVCPSSYEAFYTYEDDNLEYAGCILKTEKCMYSDEDNGLDFIPGAIDGICYASAVVE